MKRLSIHHPKGLRVLQYHNTLLRAATVMAAATVAMSTGGTPGALAAARPRVGSSPGVTNQLPVRSLRDAPVTRLIVRYRPGASARRGEAVAGAASVSAASLAQPGAAGGGGYTTVDLAKPVSRAVAEQAARQLAADPRVVSAEPDIRMQALDAGPMGPAAPSLHPASATTPNDSYYSIQWALNGTYGVNAPHAWAASRGSGVVVAVLDTGITDHPDLTGQTVPGYDMISDPAISNDGDGRDSDPSDPGDWSGTPGQAGFLPSSWHGTHVSGTIAAATDNATGVAGLAPLATVQPVRVLGVGGGSSSDIEAGIYWAAGLPVSGIPTNPTPAKVINMSLGGTGTCDTAMQAAIDAATAAGVSVVVAAGNESSDIADVTPANCRNVIVVSATTTTGVLAPYSNFGAVTLAAPGGYSTGAADAQNGILSTWNDGQTTPTTPDYAFATGTSMATPHVSAAAALLLAREPGLTPAQVEARLTLSARPLAGCPSSQCGAGLLDAGAALVSRLAGSDRYATSAAISAASFAPGVSTAYIATGSNFPDALSGASVAGHVGGPVLLVAPTSIPAVVETELSRLQPGRIVILGGTGVVSSAVETALSAYTTGTVTRLAGSDRYATSAAISAASFAPGVSTAYIATGSNFPDALSGASVAGHAGGPVLLVAPTSIPAVVETELSRLQPGRIVILGGTGVVSSAVETALSAYTTGTVTRLAGSDRYATSAAISAASFAPGVSTAYIATGSNFPDALSGASVAGHAGGPVLLVAPTSVPSAVATELHRLGPKRIVMLGGAGVVSQGLQSQLATYLG